MLSRARQAPCGCVSVRAGVIPLVAVLAALCAAAQARAQTDPVEAFYRGKTVRIVVGYSAGGGYDLNARALARHIGRHIPGHPNAIVQNMPGAGSMVAANHLFHVAPKDGTVFGTFYPGLPLE